jgi:DNA-binding transcriptional ArsR family regulator
MRACASPIGSSPLTSTRPYVARPARPPTSPPLRPCRRLYASVAAAALPYHCACYRDALLPSCPRRVVQVRLMRVATQSAATDPTTGTIDMDLITTGRSAASRTLASQLSEALRERFGAMGPQTLRLDELRQSCMADTGLDVPIGALREALGVLERDGLVRLTRQNTVTILS